MKNSIKVASYKVSLHRIRFKSLRRIIGRVFASDSSLYRYHQSPERDMAAYAYGQLAGWRGQLPMMPFRVTLYGQEIGYTVLLKDPYPFLISFGIDKEFRTGPILGEWLEAIEREFGDVYLTAVHEINERALRFFVRNGFTVECIKDKNVMLLCPH